MELKLIILIFAGFMLSLYSVWIDLKIKKNRAYKPFCDLSDLVSCSKPIASGYSNFFIFSNGVWGIIFYSTLFFLACYNMHFIIRLLASMGVFVSLGLAYILYKKIGAICLICTSIYIINVLIFLIAFEIL